MARKRKVIEGWAAQIGIMYLTPAGHWAPLSLENTVIHDSAEEAMGAGCDALGILLLTEQCEKLTVVRVRQSLEVVA